MGTVDEEEAWELTDEEAKKFNRIWKSWCVWEVLGVGRKSEWGCCGVWWWVIETGTWWMEGVSSQSYDADKLSPCNKQGVAACSYMWLGETERGKGWGGRTLSLLFGFDVKRIRWRIGLRDRVSNKIRHWVALRRWKQNDCPSYQQGCLKKSLNLKKKL